MWWGNNIPDEKATRMDTLPSVWNQEHVGHCSGVYWRQFPHIESSAGLTCEDKLKLHGLELFNSNLTMTIFPLRTIGSDFQNVLESIIRKWQTGRISHSNEAPWSQLTLIVTQLTVCSISLTSTHVTPPSWTVHKVLFYSDVCRCNNINVSRLPKVVEQLTRPHLALTVPGPAHGHRVRPLAARLPCRSAATGWPPGPARRHPLRTNRSPFPFLLQCETLSKSWSLEVRPLTPNLWQRGGNRSCSAECDRSGRPRRAGRSSAWNHVFLRAAFTGCVKSRSFDKYYLRLFQQVET